MSFSRSYWTAAVAAGRVRLAGLPCLAAVLAVAACIPAGNAVPSDAGPSPSASATPTTPAFRPSTNVMTAPFEDNFDRPASAGADAAAPDKADKDKAAALAAAATAEGGAAEASTPATPTSPASNLGPNWSQAGTEVWRIENGRLCGANAKNHGVWLQRTLPVNARIEFDAVSDVVDGDLKAEVWGDGRSAATGISYTNATSYLTIFGGWHNTLHALARLNEHGTDRKLIKVDKTSDDPTEKPVTAGQTYHFKIERTDGKTVKWAVDGVDMLAWTDASPLAGAGHDHFGFNDWEAKVCFDNVKVTPLP